MNLTFAEFKSIIAPYAGTTGSCSGSKEVDLFAYQVMQLMLFSGSTSAIRKICLLANKGCLSLPPEVETVIKARIDRKVAEIWSKWMTMSSGSDGLEDCPPVSSVLIEDGDTTPLAYGLPEGGTVIGVMAHCEEDPNAYIEIQSKDPTGRLVYTPVSDGSQILGERFKMVKGECRFGKVIVGEITGVVKPKTNGYISLFAVDPVQQQMGQFLADWAPSETRPQYRKFKVISRDCPPIAHISMLCRVKLRDSYHDNDITLFDNQLAVLLAAQRWQSEVNSDSQTAIYKKQAVEDILEKEAGYKRPQGLKVDVYVPLSGASIRNIV